MPEGLGLMQKTQGWECEVTKFKNRSFDSPAIRFAQDDGIMHWNLKAGGYRCIRADPPCANARTCSTVAMVVSPGKVVSSAPWAQPSLTDSSGDSPLSSP